MCWVGFIFHMKGLKLLLKMFESGEKERLRCKLGTRKRERQNLCMSFSHNIFNYIVCRMEVGVCVYNLFYVLVYASFLFPDRKSVV